MQTASIAAATIIMKNAELRYQRAGDHRSERRADRSAKPDDGEQALALLGRVGRFTNDQNCAITIRLNTPIHRKNVMPARPVRLARGDHKETEQRHDEERRHRVEQSDPCEPAGERARAAR